MRNRHKISSTIPAGSSLSREVTFRLHNKSYSASLHLISTGEVDFIHIDLNETIPLPITRVKKMHELFVFGLVQVLRDLGINITSKDEINVRFEANPQGVLPIHNQPKRYTVFFDLAPATSKERISPQIQFAMVSVNYKIPRLIHWHRLLRKRKVRKLRKHHNKLIKASSNS